MRTLRFKVERRIKFKPEVVDHNYPDNTWKILEHGIHEIYNDITKPSYEGLYRHACNMVTHGFGERLYSGLVSTMTFHVETMSKCIEAANDSSSFLEELSTKWNVYKTAVEVIRDVFMYMEIRFVASTHKTPILELGLNLWRDTVIRSENICIRIVSTLLELILRERTGEVIDRALMRNVIKMLIDMGPLLYQECFEEPFLEASAEFYRAESEGFIEHCDCWEYLKIAESRLNEEVERVSNYLDAKSESKITRVVAKEMIENHMLRLVEMINSGLVKIISDDKFESIVRKFFLSNMV